MNNIIYVSATVPESLYQKQLSLDDKTDQQGQKFNRSVMKGFVENGFTVHAVCYRKNIITDKTIFIENGINWHILNCKNNIIAFIKSIIEVRKLLKAYNNTFVFCDVLNMSVAAGAIVATKRKKCIDYIYAEIDDKIKINPYCDNKSFIMWINDILNNSQNNKYSEIKQEIKEMLNKIKKQNSEKIKIMDNILKLKNNYTTLSIFNFSQKKKLKEQISQLEQQLQELSFDDYPDITENLYKYFN